MRILIIGAGRGGSALFEMLKNIDRMEIVGLIDKNPKALGFNLAKRYDVPVDTTWNDWLQRDIDIIIEATGNKQVLNQLLIEKTSGTIVIPGTIAYIISELFQEKEQLLNQIKLQMESQSLILNNMHTGIIVIGPAGTIQFVNERAKQILDLKQMDVLGFHISKIIKESRLPKVIKTRQKEFNQKLTLENNRQIVTTRMPIINAQEEVIGAFATFKDVTEVVQLAEENTNLKELKTMLKAIIHSSDEAISVVDEKGLGLIINPAYTRLTGLDETSVLGQPATVDISEGESMHMKVLQTRKPVRGVPMKVGKYKKDVLVNAAPIVVNNKVKGSVGVLHDVSEIQTLTKQLNRAKQRIRSLEAKYTFNDIIGPSDSMQLALEQAKIGAKTPATVLLRGESGTGKELFAHAIHHESDRQHEKFIRVNCASISETLLESELFGYEEGAFSGASRGGKKGLFEEAHLGTIFLDEIGELSLSTQAKLLRVLQENEIIRVGGTEPIVIDVRVIAATNVHLEKAIADGTFREDLYYRLNRLPIFIPSLRERKEDLRALSKHLIEQLNISYGRNIAAIDDAALSYLKKHNWPGNVRELENVIGRAMIYMDRKESIIQRKHIPQLDFITNTRPTVHEDDFITKPLQDALADYEKQLLLRAYEANNFNKTKTAKVLGISIRTLYYKFEKYELE